MKNRQIPIAYAGARVTKLVGRDKILQVIKEAIDKRGRQTSIFYIEAPGGTGKTFLSREILARCRPRGDWAASNLLAARDEIDLYHHQVHSYEGFMAAFVEVVDEDGAYFAEYREQHRHLQETRYSLRGATKILQELQKSLVRAFLKGCQELSRKKRLIVVLDTVEKLDYEADRVQRDLELAEASSSVRPWLLETWLPQVQNAVILICGRPTERFAPDLKAAMEAQSHVEFYDKEEEPDVALGNFSADDTEKYFEALEETADGQVRKRLDAISPESRQVIHYLTEGHPITLALMIDYYLITGRLLSEVKTTLAKLETLSAEELDRIRQRVKADVVRQFQEIGRPADEVIRALAWAPKGMDAELLSRVAVMELEEAKQVLHMLSDRETGLSFIKIRPADRRAFLHDEMYALLREHLLDRLPEAHAEEVYETILAYYADRIRAQQKKIQQLQAPQRDGLLPDGRVVLPSSAGTVQDPQELAEARIELDNLQVEEVYYRLRYEPLNGFAQYCEYAEAAVSSNHDSLDMQLRDEMLSFVKEAFGQADVFRGLCRDDVERDSALRWIWRNMYAAKPEKAYEIARYLRQEAGDFLKKGGLLAEAELDILEGWAAAFTGRNLRRTKAQVQAAVDALLQLGPESDFEQLRRDVLLAQGYNILGYVLRVQGRFRSACDEYRRALPYWRKLKREADHAETLNNLAWASAEAGNFGQAIRRCHDGLELREQLGHTYLIALSYNTLGLIEIKADQPHRGRVHCQRALDMCQALGVRRGVGLASLGLAEAHRRCAEAPGVYFAPEKVNQLRLALDFAQRAVQIFDEEIPESLRQVEAFNELGCIYRNWARVARDYQGDGDPPLDQLVQKGAQALREAADRATGRFPYRRVDALVNLAWLYYYTNSPDRAQEALRQAERSVPPDYFYTEEKQNPVATEDAIAFLWVQLGKSHLLKGLMALQEYEQQPPVPNEIRDEGLWRTMAEHFTLALAYDELFAEDFRDMRRAKDTMDAALRKVNVGELSGLYRAVDATAEKYGLEHRERAPGQPARPRMRNFLEENFGTPEEMDITPV